MTAQSNKSEKSTEETNALREMGEAISNALEKAPVSEVLSIITGTFVGLTTELVKRQGQDPDLKIEINGGNERSITIHAKNG